MSRRIEVEFVNDSCALLRGHQSRELYVEVKGRPPVWAVRDRAWVGQPHTIKDVCALAESRGFVVDVKAGGVPPARKGGGAAIPHFEPVVEQPDPGRGLW